MANFCGCWNIKDGCITIAVWSMLFSLIQVAIFGWQMPVIKHEKDVAFNVMFPYNVPAQAFDRDQRYYERDSGFYRSPEVRTYTAIFIVQIIIVVLTVFLFVASAALAYGIYTEAHYLIWPWLPVAILNICACMAYCGCWWIGYKDLRQSHRPDMYTVTGYWYILTIVESVFALVNLYCVACVITLYTSIYNASRPGGSDKARRAHVYYAGGPADETAVHPDKQGGHLDGAPPPAAVYFGGGGQANPGYDAGRLRAQQQIQHQQQQQYPASTIQMSDLDARRYAPGQPVASANGYAVNTAQYYDAPPPAAAEAPPLPPKRALAAEPNSTQRRQRPGGGRSRSAERRPDGEGRRGRSASQQHSCHHRHRHYRSQHSGHRERSRRRSDSESSSAGRSGDDTPTEPCHAHSRRRPSRRSRRSRSRSAHAAAAREDNWSTSETELQMHAAADDDDRRRRRRHRPDASRDAPPAGVVDHRASSSSTTAGGGRAATATATPDGGLVIPQTIYIPPPRAGHGGERRRFRIDNEIKIDYSDRSAQPSPGHLTTAADVDRVRMQQPAGAIDRPGSTTV